MTEDRVARELADNQKLWDAWTPIHAAGEFYDAAVPRRPDRRSDPTAQVDADVEHGWNHPLGEIVTLLARNGLRIELLDEKRELGWPMPFLQGFGPERFGFPHEQAGTLPLMFSLRARRDA